MKTSKFMIVIAILSVTLVTGLFMTRSERGPMPWHTNDAGTEHQLTAYMSPTCGCCPIHAGYLKNQGYQVKTELTEDMEQVKQRFGVPEELFSCHTTVVNDGQYFIEGHIPVEAIDELLKSEPAISGIGMPGMPSGSPGMPGPKNGLFEVMQLDNDDQLKLFMSV